ncbi:MAG: hypothetical protein ABIH41_03965 [Nanoarchaeota archaeon]
MTEEQENDYVTADDILIWTLRKEELSDIDETYAMRILADELRRHHVKTPIIDRTHRQAQRNKDVREAMKAARSRLREVYGAFKQVSLGKVDLLLDALQRDPDSQTIHREILSLHQSTKERLDHYAEMYQSIWNVTGTPRRILDLGCGLNPIAYPSMGCRPHYVANEVSEAYCAAIRRYFKIGGIEGEAFSYDLTSFTANQSTTFLKSDVCLMLKIVDTLETVSRNSAWRLIEGIPSTWFVVSFPTTSLGGMKTIPDRRRAWFENMLKHHNITPTTFHIPHEQFYVFANPKTITTNT